MAAMNVADGVAQAWGVTCASRCTWQPLSGAARELPSLQEGFWAGAGPRLS